MQTSAGGFAGVASGWRSILGFARCVLLLPAFYLVWDLLSVWGTYAGSEHGLSLLAALGTAGGLGYLASYAYRNSRHLSCTCSFLSGGNPLEARHSGSVLVESVDWPLLVALLFGPFFVLLAGLGGWV